MKIKSKLKSKIRCFFPIFWAYEPLETTEKEVSQRIDYKNWMERMAAELHNRKLNEIDIPGAHHAGFLTVDFLNTIPGVWSKCQNKSINSLLNEGVRWLDLRIGENDGIIFFTHTCQSQQKLSDALKEIKVWIQENAGEILILDIHVDVKFKPTKKTNYALKNLPFELKSTFGSLLISGEEFKNCDFGQLIASNKRIALTGDFRLGNEINDKNSWESTKSSKWQELVRKVINWIPKDGYSAIKNGQIAVSSAAISPIATDLTPPSRVAASTNAALSRELRFIKSRLGVVELDFVSQDAVETIINHNILK